MVDFLSVVVVIPSELIASVILTLFGLAEQSLKGGPNTTGLRYGDNDNTKPDRQPWARWTTKQDWPCSNPEATSWSWVGSLYKYIKKSWVDKSGLRDMSLFIRREKRNRLKILIIAVVYNLRFVRGMSKEKPHFCRDDPGRTRTEIRRNMGIYAILDYSGSIEKSGIRLCKLLCGAQVHQWEIKN